MYINNQLVPLTASGPVSLTSYTEAISLIEGRLEGFLSTENSVYTVVSSFQKQIGHSGAEAGITIYPAAESDQAVFFSVGEHVYTEEIQAVHPMFIEATETSKSSIQDTSSVDSISTSSVSASSSYQKITSGSATIKSNIFNATGKALDFSMYFKPSGKSDSSDDDTKGYNVLLLTANSNMAGLSSQATASNMFYSRFYSITITVSSANDTCKLGVLHVQNTGSSGSTGISIALLSALLTLIKNPFLSAFAAGAQTLFAGVLATQYGYTMDVANVNSTYTFAVKRSEKSVCFDSYPIAIDYTLSVGANKSFPINATAKMEYMLIGEYGDVYYVSTNTVSISGNVYCYM